MRRALLAALLALAVAGVPAVQATHAGHTYEFEDTIVHALPVPYVASSTHDYEIAYVSAGTTITATLTWEEDPTQDMGLSVYTPGDVCSISPEEDPACFLGVADDVTCGGATDPAPPTENSLERNVVAENDGEYTISVQSKLAERFERVDYELTLTLDASHGSVNGPSGNGYIHDTPYCGLVE